MTELCFVVESISIKAHMILNVDYPNLRCILSFKDLKLLSNCTV